MGEHAAHQRRPSDAARESVPAGPGLGRDGAVQPSADRGLLWRAGPAFPLSSADPTDPGGLPGPLKTGVERLSGQDLSDLRVHRNSAKPATLGAAAYTQGADIYLGPGTEAHLPHETWHAVQQKQGRVPPALRINGTAINNSGDLERDAEVMGARALQPPASAEPVAGALQRAQLPNAPVVQFAGWTTEQLGKKLAEDNLIGVCNAMTAAWLAGLIDPGTEDNQAARTLGVDLNNFAQIKALKATLDYWTFGVGFANSQETTLVFLDYCRKHQINRLNAEAIEGFHKYADPQQQGADEENDDGDDGDDQGEQAAEDVVKESAVGPYGEELTAEICTAIEDALEDTFSTTNPLQGIISFEDWKEDEQGDKDNDSVDSHQWGFRYRPDARLLEIFDQNTGLVRVAVSGEDDMFDALSDHVALYTELNRNAGATHASVRIAVRPS